MLSVVAWTSLSATGPEHPIGCTIVPLLSMPYPQIDGPTRFDAVSTHAGCVCEVHGVCTRGEYVVLCSTRGNVRATAPVTWDDVQRETSSHDPDQLRRDHNPRNVANTQSFCSPISGGPCQPGGECYWVKGMQQVFDGDETHRASVSHRMHLSICQTRKMHVTNTWLISSVMHGPISCSVYDCAHFL